MTRTCEEPLDLRTLVDYWFEDLSDAETERVEEHLFQCDDCGGRLRALAELGDDVRRLAREGTVQVVVSPSFLETASSEGLRIREYIVPPGGRVDCTVTPRDDLLVSRMRADFSGVSRLDVRARAEGYPEVWIKDVPVSPDASELILAQAMPALRALGRTVMHYRLVAREGELERVLGDYAFDHTPTPS